MFKCKLLLSIILILSFTQIIFAKDFPIDNEFTVQERLNCSIQAGLKYNVPIDVLLAISSIENGNIDTISKNTNNSYDYGVMQINSIYIKELNNKGFLYLAYIHIFPNILYYANFEVIQAHYQHF